MRIGLMVPEFSPSDAVGNDVLGMYRAIKLQGADCYVFTQTGVTQHNIEVHKYTDVPTILRDSSDLIIFHYCVWDPSAIEAIRQSPARIVLKYHNLTPASFFAPYSKDYSRSCKMARDGLSEVCKLPLIWAICDSHFNSEDLASLLPAGVGRSVIAPFHQTSDLIWSPDDLETQLLLDHSWFNILTVGRVVPNKAMHLMMPALANMQERGLFGIRLHIVGSQDVRLAQYLSIIEKEIASYGLQDAVVMHRFVSTAKLANLYRYCDFLWITSQHEGFCVPVVEAMASGLPILSTRHCALPETCADAAVFADSVDEMANQLARLVTNDTLRVQLRAAGERRYRETFSDLKIQDRFLAEIDRLSSMTLIQASDGDVEWFGFPLADQIEELSHVAAYLGAPVLLASEDGRRNFVDWIVRNESTGIWPKAGVRAESLRAFAARLDMPGSACHFDAAMRFAWHFNSDARTLFRLRSSADVAAFVVWYQEFGAAYYDAAFVERHT